MNEIYSSSIFKNEILSYINANGYDPIKVAKFASHVFLKNQSKIDSYLRGKLLDLMTMEDGVEFEMTEEEFKIFIQNL